MPTLQETIDRNTVSPDLQSGPEIERFVPPAPALPSGPVQAPTAAPTAGVEQPTPTIGESLEAARLQALDIQEGIAGLPGDPTFAASTPLGVEAAPEAFDEEGARRNATRRQLQLHQAEIDAVNQIAQQELAQARLEQTGRLGSQRAIGARGGILGSDFAGAQKEKVQQFGAGIRRGIEAERTAKIGAIMGNVRQSVLDEVTAKREARQQGADEYLDFLKRGQERKTTNVSRFAQDLLAQGFDITDIEEEELQAFAKEAGVTTQDLVAGFARAQASVAGEVGEPFTLKQGEQRFDAEGNLVASGADKPTILKEGDVIVDAEGNVVRKIAKTSAAGTGGGKGLTSGSLDLTSEDVSEGAQQLEASRGADGYSDTQTYADMLSLFAEQGGLVQDFVKTYPADLYLNPNDPTVKEFIKTELQRDTTDELTKLLFGGV